MGTVMAPVEEGGGAASEMPGGADTAPATITTTQYDLIAALQDVVQPGEDALVVATMVHLLGTGRITLLSGIEALESVV